MSKYGVFSGPYFPRFRLNTERNSLSIRIQSECGKIRTRKNSVFGHFSCSDKRTKDKYSKSFALSYNECQSEVWPIFKLFVSHNWGLWDISYCPYMRILVRSYESKSRNKIRRKFLVVRERERINCQVWVWRKIWVNVFKNGSGKICGRQPLKILKWYGLWSITSKFLKAVFHKFYLVHSWPIYQFNRMLKKLKKYLKYSIYRFMKYLEKIWTNNV